MIEDLKNFVADKKVEISERRVAEKVGASGLDDFVRYLRSPWRIIWSNLLAGIFRGLGFLIGATVIVAVAVYILVQILGNLPIVGEWFAEVGAFLTNIQESASTLNSIGR